MADRKTFLAPVTAGGIPSPVLEPAEHDLDPVTAPVVLGGCAAGGPARDARINPLSFKASPNQPASWPRSASSESFFGNPPGRATTPVSSLTWPAVTEGWVGRPSALAKARSLVFMPPLVRPVRRPLWPPAHSPSPAGWSPRGAPPYTCAGILGPRARHSTASTDCRGSSPDHVR